MTTPTILTKLNHTFRYLLTYFISIREHVYLSDPFLAPHTIFYVSEIELEQEDQLNDRVLSNSTYFIL